MTRILLPVVAIAASFGMLSTAAAHCGANDECVYAPCHHGPNAPECQAATGAAKITARIAEPAVREEVREIIIPKVPQLNLPVGAGAKVPASAPSSPGRIDPRSLPPGAALPSSVNLPPSAIARDVAPQVFSGTLAAMREIDNARALEKLQKNNPRLANSNYLRERRQKQLGEVFEQLKLIDKRAKKAVDGLGTDERYDDLRGSLSRAAALLESFGSGDGPAERK
jgi:hypothetical protein